jgi:hypothetical protein
MRNWIKRLLSPKPKELPKVQSVELYSKGTTGGKLREIIIESSPHTLYPNQSKGMYRVAFPFEVVVELRFADGVVQKYTAFNANVQPMLFMDWAPILEPLAEQLEAMEIKPDFQVPEFIVEGPPFKLTAVYVDVELPNVTKAKPDQPFKSAPNVAMGTNTGVTQSSTKKTGKNIPRFAGVGPYDPNEPTLSPATPPLANPATVMTKDGAFTQGKGLVERKKPLAPPAEEDNWSKPEDKSP